MSFEFIFIMKIGEIIFFYQYSYLLVDKKCDLKNITFFIMKSKYIFN